MKISFRILLINFVIVALIFISSTVVYYTLTQKLIVLQNSKVLSNSVSDFSIALSSVIQDNQDDFFHILNNRDFSNIPNIEKYRIDFAFCINPDSSFNPDFSFLKPSLIHPGYNDVRNFRISNPGALIQEFKTREGKIYLFGCLFTNELLDRLSKRIRADIALISGNIDIRISDSAKNNVYLSHLINAENHLSEKISNVKNIYVEELDNSDFYASLYKTANNNFIIFNTLPEAAELRHNINQFLLIIGITGVALSLILVLFFTDKIRKQITQLSKAADVIKGGNIHHRVLVLSKDELGELGTAFNNMLDEIERKENSKNEYAEFISLINRNPSLNEVAEAALDKIVKLTNSSVGQLYLVNYADVELITSYGIQRELAFSKEKIDLFKQVIEKSETIEFKFTENNPKISTGLVELELKYILIFPIVYNKNVIAVLELGSVTEPRRSIREYLENIHDQLAIGLTNANTLRQLENFVKELKVLNEEYQKQNDQVIEQNNKLVELHQQLKEKAEELEIQKEKAIESTSVKSLFLATVSHELRTPLNSILGLTELVLGDKTLTKQTKDRLRVVLRNGNRLIALINDILEFTKIEASKAEIKKEDFKLKELINDVEIQILPLVQDKNVKFLIHNEIETNLRVNSDRDKIMHILINLLSNSAKFTEEGMIILKVQIDKESLLHFEIIDSGIGIEEKDLTLIFEEFRQADSTSTRKYSGAGLGLSICKKYADLLNGKIYAKSEIGKGSVFTLVLPVDVVEDKETIDTDQLSLDLDGNPIVSDLSFMSFPEAPVKLSVSEVKAESVDGKLILVMDALLDHQEIVGPYLMSKNYKVIFTSGYDDTLQVISKQKPFAIILNIFSLKRGWELLKLVKENSETKHIPIIPLIFLDEFSIGYGLPVLDFFVKPIPSIDFDNYLKSIEDLTKSSFNKITIIDRDAEFYNNLCNIVKDTREVHFIDDGSTAFNSVMNLQPDIVIIDILMCQLDGISIIYQLKEAIETKDIPVIITIPEALTDKDAFQLNHNLEKSALKSKKNKIDVLKIIRDRLFLEEGITSEEISTFGIGQGTENSLGSVPSSEHKSRVKRLNKPKVLIVDDDTDTLFTVGEIVRQSGCDIVFAKNGLECLSSLQMFTPDLILLDIMMPRMDGFETIKRIRAENTFSNIPVFALTAQAMLDDKDIIIRNGFDDFISKPVNPGLLISKIEKRIVNTSTE